MVFFCCCCKQGPSLLLGSGLNVFLESRDGTGDDNYQKQQANEWVAQDNRQDDDDDDDKKLPLAAPMDCNGNSDVDSVDECIEDTLLPDIDHDMDVWKDRTIYKTCPKTHSQYFVGEPNHHHVRFGRGDCHTKGAANVHFHELILAFQPYYKASKDKLLVIQEVKRALQMANMRFVRKDGTVWWVVPFGSQAVYRKISQTLRDDHSFDGRKRKRDRYVANRRQTAQKEKKGSPRKSAVV